MKSKTNKKIAVADKGWKEWVCRFIERYEILIFILLFVALLRLPSLAEPNRYADEDIYLTLGQGLRKGLVFYRDIHDNKPPLLYLTAALAGNVMWFRLILLGWNLINVVLIWKIAEKLLKETKTRAVTTFLFALLTTIPLTEGNIANGEVFMIMPVTAAVLLLLNEKKSGWRRYLTVGFLFAVGFLFKVPVAFDFAGIMIWFFVYEAKNIKGVLKTIVDKRAWLILSGFLIPIALSIGYYYTVGAGAEYVRAAFGQNVGYVSSWEGERQAFYESGMVQRGIVLVAWLVGILFLKKKLGKEMGLVAIWLVFALFGANLSGRPYPHYLIEVVPPLALLVGLLMEKGNRWKRGVGIGLLLTIGLAIWRYQFWYYPSLPYYHNYLQYLTGQKDREDYKAFFGNGVLRNEVIGEYIRMRTEEGERIYVWGTEPAIYVTADRLPVGRYTVSYHVRDFDGFEETLRLLKEQEPKYIVVMEYEEEFRGLSRLLSARYIEVLEVEDARVYRRL